MRGSQSGFITFAFASLVLIVVLVGEARAGQIVNGSFESPTAPAGSYTDFPGGSTAITGWTVVGVDAALIGVNYVYNSISLPAEDGDQWIDLTGPGTNSMANGVTQDVATTIGQTYVLRFFVGSATDNATVFASTVDLSINGGPRVGYTNPNAPTDVMNWQMFSLPFTATSATTNLTFYNGSASNNNLSALDNVSLSAVPEPHSIILGVIGAAIGFGVTWSRRGWRA